MVKTAPAAVDRESSIYGDARWFGMLVEVSDKSVYRLVKADPTFPCVWIGGSLRIPKERALKWLRDREQGSGRHRLRAVKTVDHQQRTTLRIEETT